MAGAQIEVRDGGNGRGNMFLPVPAQLTGMARDGRDDPFDDLFDELERLMDDLMATETSESQPSGGNPEFGGDVHVDVHETETEVRVVADLPPVPEEALRLRCDGSVFTIDLDAEARQLNEQISLPTRVDEHSAQATYNNGVLEVRFDRQEPSANISLE